MKALILTAPAASAALPILETVAHHYWSVANGASNIDVTGPRPLLPYMYGQHYFSCQLGTLVKCSLSGPDLVPASKNLRRTHDAICLQISWECAHVFQSHFSIIEMVTVLRKAFVMNQ